MKGNHFLTIIDKFSKFGAAYLLNDRNHITIVEQLEEHFAKLGKPRKIIADNEFKAVRIREFLDTENVELHLTKPNSHTGNADIERFHNTIAEKFRILYKLEKGLSIKHLIQKAIRNYNDRFHSTIKCTPNEVHDNKIDPQIIKSNLEAKKHKIISNLNKTRKDYKEERTEGFIKNYKAVRHKEQPKYRKEKLENIHPNNIKRPLKFADTNYDISADMVKDSDIVLHIIDVKQIEDIINEMKENITQVKTINKNVLQAELLEARNKLMTLIPIEKKDIREDL